MGKRYNIVVDDKDVAKPTEYVGTVTNIFHCDMDFTAGELLPDGEYFPIRFSGEVQLGVGDRIEARGEWRNLPRFGEQFIIDDFSYEPPKAKG